MAPGGQGIIPRRGWRGPHIPLKTALLAAGMSQRKLARELGIQESVLSMAVHGKYVLEDWQRELTRRVLTERGAPDPFPEEQ